MHRVFDLIKCVDYRVAMIHRLPYVVAPHSVRDADLVHEPSQIFDGYTLQQMPLGIDQRRAITGCQYMQTFIQWPLR